MPRSKKNAEKRLKRARTARKNKPLSKRDLDHIVRDVVQTLANRKWGPHLG